MEGRGSSSAEGLGCGFPVHSSAPQSRQQADTLPRPRHRGGAGRSPGRSLMVRGLSFHSWNQGSSTPGPPCWGPVGWVGRRRDTAAGAVTTAVTAPPAQRQNLKIAGQLPKCTWEERVPPHPGHRGVFWDLESSRAGVGSPKNSAQCWGKRAGSPVQALALQSTDAHTLGDTLGGNPSITPGAQKTSKAKAGMRGAQKRTRDGRLVGGKEVYSALPRLSPKESGEEQDGEQSGGL